ncbi:MAG: crotonobetainyl-CoA:carnitine CoA-transferase CaiB-like acyl-CoA transferase [Hyphomicrobiaceae bacterium]|jgi:crotonobetainyl-CoA:carnitine CoA-transferase CaiB-like acyl-CoA transferase
MSRMSRPLDSIRVADFTHVLAGPFCTRILCDLGADVIKVETPGGDLSRRLGPRRGGMSGYFMQQNCGKRNVSIDLRQPEGKALALELIAASDVVVENFRPGAMDGLGLGWKDAQAVNERVVYCSISGFGHASPLRDQRAFAGIAHATTGMLARQAQAWKTAPQDSVLAVGDTVTGLQATIAVLAALRVAESTGKGQWIDLAMHDALLAIQEAANFHSFGSDSDEYDFLCSWLYPCGEDWVVLPSDPRADWPRLCSVMNRPDLAAEPRYSSYEERVGLLQELETHVAQWIEAFSSGDAAVKFLHAKGLAAARVMTMSEALESEQTRARNMAPQCDDRNGGTVPVLNSPYRFSESESGVTGRAAFRGEDNKAVFCGLLGHSDDDVQRLVQQGVLTDRIPTREPGASS